ncbi:unnamed protein product [Sphagnum tenellum]
MIIELAKLNAPELEIIDMETPVVTVAWDMLLAYRMVRQRDHTLTDRQRTLQYEQGNLSEQLSQLRTRIEKLADAIAVVEKAGGDASSLRTQIDAAHAERRHIEPRHKYLEEATSIIAANLRLIHQAHDALHWLRFENNNLVDFDRQVIT